MLARFVELISVTLRSYADAAIEAANDKGETK